LFAHNVVRRPQTCKLDKPTAWHRSIKSDNLTTKMSLSPQTAGEWETGRDIRISNQFLITRALHFAQLRLRPLNYTLRPNVIVTLA